MAASKSDDTDNLAANDEGATSTMPLNIGVHAFFVAKRAAVKLKAFWKSHKIQKELEEAEAKKNQLEEK